MKKQKMTPEAIAENTDEYGIINWDNIEIPTLNVDSPSVEVEYVPPMADDVIREYFGDIADRLIKLASLEGPDEDDVIPDIRRILYKSSGVRLIEGSTTKTSDRVPAIMSSIFRRIDSQKIDESYGVFFLLMTNRNLTPELDVTMELFELCEYAACVSPIAHFTWLIDNSLPEDTVQVSVLIANDYEAD